MTNVKDNIKREEGQLTKREAAEVAAGKQRPPEVEAAPGPRLKAVLRDVEDAPNQLDL